MVAHRTLTPFVRVRILHPLPKAAHHLVSCFLFYGLQRPQGEYPAATASSRVENQTRLSSDILAADGQKGIWNLSDLLLAV